MFINMGRFFSERLHWLSSQYWTWWSFFKSRARQLLSRLWKVFVIYSLAAFLLAAVLTILFYSYSKTLLPEVLVGLYSMIEMMFGWITVVGAGAIFGLAFLLLFILSLFPKGRGIADGFFKFSEATELEKFKKEVDGELTSIKGEIGSIKDELVGINTRLGNLETNLTETLRTMEVRQQGRPRQMRRRKTETKRQEQDNQGEKG